MPEVKKHLEIRMGASIELQKREERTIAIVPHTFDLVDDFNGLDSLLNETFDEVYVYTSQVQKTFWHACVLISFLKFNTVFKVNETSFLNKNKIQDITSNINNLKIDFHCHDVKAEPLGLESSRKVIIDITKRLFIV